MSLLTTPATYKQQLYCYLIITLIIISSSFLYAEILHPISFIWDDSYILLHNIQVLISGYDLNYPGVSALDGTTSLAHLVLVRIFSFFLSPILALYTATWLAILLYALGLLRLVFIYSASTLQATLLVFSGLLIGYTFINLLSGLETGLALAALTWTIIFIITEQRVARNLLLGLLPFIRPELILFSFIFEISCAYTYWLQQKSIQFVSLNLLKDFLIMSVSALPFALWYYLALGTPYPETLEAKKYFFAEQNIAFPQKLFVGISLCLKFGGSLGIFNFIALLIFMLCRSLSRIFLLFFLSFLLLYIIVYPHGLAIQAYRYLYIWLPFMLYGVIAHIQHPQKILKLFSNTLLAILAFSALFYFPKHWKNYIQTTRQVTQLRIALKTWCEKNIPSNATLLIQDAGYLAYATHFHLIDFVGLKTPANIRYHRDITYPSSGHKRGLAIAEIIRSTHPQYFIITQDWNAVFGLTDALKAEQIDFQKIATEKSYLVYRFT